MKWICILTVFGGQYYTRTIYTRLMNLVFFDYGLHEKISIPISDIRAIFPSERNDIK